MALQVFNTHALAQIDGGRIAKAYELALKRAESDCKDRPAVKGARTVVLRAVIVPVISEEDGELDSCNVRFEINETAPKKQSKTFNMVAGRDGLKFNEFSPEDANQGTLDPMLGNGPKKTAHK